MLSIHVERVGDIAIIECKGRIVRSEAAFKLRDAFTSQRDARTIVLDVSEVEAIEGGGFGMLCFLQLWARDNNVQLKVVNPSSSLRDKLGRANCVLQFDVAALEEMITLVAGQRLRAG